jgi:hypothetical protein
VKRPPPNLVEFLSRYDSSVLDLALSARRTVLGEVPSAVETVNDVSYAVTNGFTFSGRFKEAFCYVVAYPAHVNLGFNRGTELPDPDGLLTGTGKLNRHVRIGSQADLKSPAVRRLIHAAADQAEVIFRK